MGADEPLNQLLVYECSQSAASSVMLHSTTLRVVRVLIQLEFYYPFTSLKKKKSHPSFGNYSQVFFEETHSKTLNRNLRWRDQIEFRAS